MSSDFEKVDELYHQALSKPPAERANFLKSACGGDEELCREVGVLLAYQEKAGKFMDAPAMDVAARMLARSKDRKLAGSQLGPYEILSLLGAGGMGEVYLARDSRLERTVAVKVLPAELIDNRERLKRFVQEAKAASSLNHPNIITIYDIGSEGGIDFVVMEHVAGKTLDQWIPRKGMRLNETLKLAIQMADALAKAHSAGIVHRDLKPTNVMVTDNGLVKVLDFGLAKLTEVLGNVEGVTRTLQSLTEEGMIVGTVSYMSPEKAEGKKVDARSDIFSFGAVLYEMVTGQKAFQGDSKLSTLTAVLKQEPKPISQLVPSVPRDLEKIIARCLRKDPSRRFQTMADLKVTLEELKDESDSGALAGTLPTVRPARRSWVWVAAAITVVAMGVAIWLFRGTVRKPAAALDVVPLTTYTGSERSPSFSPDGNQVAFSWNGMKQDNFDIYIKLIGSESSVRLTTDPAEDVSPAFSPDGRSIGFVRVSKDHSTFIIIPAIGGPERIVAELPDLGSFAWLPDGKWVVTDGLALLSTETGETRRLTPPSTRRHHDDSPAVSPDGRTVAFSRRNSDDWADIYLLDLTEDFIPKGEPRRWTFLKGFNFPSAWTPNGQEIIFASFFFGSGESLWKVAASGSREPERLPFGVGEASEPAVSRSGNRLAYVRKVSDANIWRLSLSGPGVATGSPSRCIASTRIDDAPQYSPDGKRIAFTSERSGVRGIWIADADGFNARELFSQAGASCGRPSWSPDGQRIAFNFDGGGNTDIYVVRASGGKPIRLTTDRADDEAGSWSRDGNWIYFASRQTGRFEVWKVSPAGGEAVRVTSNGGGSAFESPDGKYIYYVKGNWSGSLCKMPVGGGKESQVLPSVSWNAFSLVNEGIYFISEPGADGKSSIQFVSFPTGKVKTVAPMTSRASEGLSVSPDGRFLLFSQVDAEGSDLMLVENFR